MATTGFSSTTIGWTALVTGIAGVLSLVFIVLFFTIGQPFGTLNDFCIGLAGLSSGVLASMLYAEHHLQSPLNQLALGLALIGAVVVALGSLLVIFNITGWYLAGLYMSAGNALIGLWLLTLNYSVRQSTPWTHGLIVFGLVIGIVMALGLVVIPGIIKGIDSWDAAPWYINYIGMPGGLGYLVLYPIWCILLGRVLLK
jgi:hypothetical protein